MNLNGATVEKQYSNGHILLLKTSQTTVWWFLPLQIVWVYDLSVRRMAAWIPDDTGHDLRLSSSCQDFEPADKKNVQCTDQVPPSCSWSPSQQPWIKIRTIKDVNLLILFVCVCVFG